MEPEDCNNKEQTTMDSSSATKTVNTTDLLRLPIARKALEQIVSDLLPDLIGKLDSAVLLSFHDMEAELRHKDAEQLVAYLSVSTGDSGHDR